MPEFRTFLLKTALQQFLYHLCPEKLSLSLIHNPVIRIQTNDMKIIFQDVAAEAVDGGDLGTLDQRKLPCQVLILFSFGKLLLNGCIQTLPHLSCRCSGKRYDQELINIHRTDRIGD